MGLFALFSRPAELTASVVDEKALDDAKQEPNAGRPKPVVPIIVVSAPSSTSSKAPSLPIPETPPKPRPSSRLKSKPALHQQQKRSSTFSGVFFKYNSSEKRAKKSALIVHDLIIGPDTQRTSAHARPRLTHLKSQLVEPKSANKVIAQLRDLPTSVGSQGPIRAVCLARSDAEIQKRHFSALSTPKDDDGPSFFNGLVSLDEVSSMFNEMSIVDLISHPLTLGIGEPGDGQGLLSGALPTAETVLKGFQEITPQLMALGYATGKSVLIDHTGVYPPLDRLSVLTYWWGLELVFPPPSLKHLASVHSISGTVINFLTALALINNGIHELLPFIRYISQFIDYEFNQITQQDRGQGVVCASTWIMPAALVPRPWDFPPPPPPPATPPATPPAPSSPKTPQQPVDSPPSTEDAQPTQPALPCPTIPAPAPAPDVPSQTQPSPGIIPPSVSNLVDSVIGAYKDSVTFHPELAAASSVSALTTAA
ncbi:hypothetical protein C0992_008104 [Termitomyces sp. T32_za158]|nr:hypothetical protein C0992_008104 [Termitomyces sp. T32_za158]